MDGILIVDKPKGITSHDVVSFVRRRFGLKKVGHAGTLDPIATGVLVMLLGELTKSSILFINDDKEYEAGLILGAASDTGDALGNITTLNKNVNFTAAEIENVFKNFLGDIGQVPPMYSALKYKGKKLYELARKGLTVERQPRKICIKSLDILKISIPEIVFRITCSKGTYVRQLCIDIGEKLGCGAYMNRLRRIRSGRFGIDNAIGLDTLKEFNASDLKKTLYSL